MRGTPTIINIPRITDPRGNLSFLQNGSVIPFDIKRVFWIYDVPGGEGRGCHSHYTTELVIIAASGSFDVRLLDGVEWHTYPLNRPYQGLYVPPGYWHTLDNFSSGSVCLTLASTLYSEEDYIRDFDEYMREYKRSIK